MTLEERMASDGLLTQMVLDRSIPNRQVARTFDLDESVVRRWRNRNIVDAHPMSDKDSAYPEREGQTVQHQPGFDLSMDHGQVRTLPVPVTEDATSPEDAELLLSLGADPEKWEIVGRKDSKWMGPSGNWLMAHKLDLERKGSKTGDLNVEQLGQILMDYEPRQPAKLPHGNGIFVVPDADIQAGKIDGGGTAALVDRFGRIVQEARERLEREGGCDLLVIPVLGDCIEGIVSQGGRLAMKLDISVTEQVRVYRRLLTHIVAELSPYANRVIVPVVPGNHDEQTRQYETKVTDSWAIEGASAVADAMADNPRYSHVEFLFPDDEELSITLNVGTAQKPFVLGFTHGHMAKSPNGIEAWWGKQAFGHQHIGNADMMFTGHFHHLRTEVMPGNRTWIQAPALDGGSDWFRRQDGSNCLAGMISMWITPGRGMGWEGLTVHTGE